MTFLLELLFKFNIHHRKWLFLAFTWINVTQNKHYDLKQKEQVQYSRLRWDIFRSVHTLQPGPSGADRKFWHDEMGGGEKKGGCHNISKTFDSSAKVLFATGKKEALTFQYFNQSDHQGAPLAVFWICSLRIRMLCRCSGGNIAICSGVNCKTCMMRAAWKRKMKMLLRMLNVFFWPTSWTEQSRTTV